MERAFGLSLMGHSRDLCKAVNHLVRTSDRILSKVSPRLRSMVLVMSLSSLETDRADFEKYIMLRTLFRSDIDTSKGKRLIFIGDVHGSFDPLE